MRLEARRAKTLVQPVLGLRQPSPQAHAQMKIALRSPIVPAKSGYLPRRCLGSAFISHPGQRFVENSLEEGAHLSS